ncbi:MAG: hypothetical protein RIS34_1778 [Pseudomonadota bacterium]|jgi:fatty-acyl-CoA synthase
MNLSRFIEQHARKTPSAGALHFEGEDISYGLFWQRIERATHRLLAAGVKAGDRVAYLGLNDPAMLVLLFALARLGAILLPLNYRLAPEELRAVLVHAGAGLLVVDAHHAAVASGLAATNGIQLMAVPLLNDGASGQGARQGAGVGAPGDVCDVPEGHDDSVLTGHDALPVLLVYTSGTTGKPKGALHTQAGLIWNCLISAHAHELVPSDHVLTALPLFHVGGLCIQTLPALHAGALVTLHQRFDAGAWLADVQKRRPSIALMVPATLGAVLAHPDCAATDWSSLKLLNAGSSMVPAAMIAAVHARGVPLCQVYGATETGPVSIYLKRGDALRHPGSAGQAGLHVEVRLVNERGDEAAVGEVGEICIHAPNVMCGYWADSGNPAFRDGWFHSGDLARRDEGGFFWVVGRSKDMIISGGENIYPAELENILAECPDILEAAVVGRDDTRWGEVAVAVVVKKPGSELDANSVMALFEGRLARFKHPRHVIFRDGLPKTALGKIQKSGLLLK